MESQVEQPVHTNGMSDIEDEDRTKMRPVDIDADVREMERRKRVENIMNSKLFREELERIIESQLRDGSGPSGLLQQISDMVGVNKQSGNMFKSSSCVVPVNDIRGIEAMGYAKGEKILRCKLACLYRLIDLYGWSYGSNTLITARLNQDDEQFLINPYGLLFHEVTASSLIKVDMQGTVIEQGTTNFSVNITAYSLHAAVHSARPDIKCIIHVHTPAVVAVSSLKHGLMPLSQESVVIGEVSTHFYLGGHLDPEEKDKLARNLGPNNKVLLLTNQGALCCGETIEEAFYNARNTVLASEIQLKLMPVGVDNLVQIDDETKKKIYDAAHKPPESTPRPDQPSVLEGKVERKWRVGGVEFEALMRMLDNAGFRTGYIYRHPLVKGEPPKPKNDVEVPPAVSSLGYLLEEEELYRQGLWRKLEGGRKGNDRSRWLNSPNTYQKVEVLETGTADPKKITKWVAEGSPNHSSSAPVRIDSALQFVPKGTNPKEFKQRQQQIKDYRRADKISAGPQSHILEGVTWEEAKKMQDATVTQTGDHVVLMGAASKGIIQRGHQHNAMVYKSPYAKNPFDNITDDEINEYKKVVEKKTKGEYDTDYSESEGLSSAALNKRIDAVHIRSPTSVTSETEEESHDEPQILRIETKTVPVASQPEVVLSDGSKSENRQQYRTNSHSGLPKGSYLDPKPIHFHIARKNEVSAICIKKFIELPRKKSSNYMYKQPLKTSVTINIETDKSLSLKIPFDTVREFISPFVKVLNCKHIANSTDEESQTSYISYSPLSITDNKTFEKQILDQMKEQLLSEVFDNSESEDEWEKDIFKDIQNITHFDENDQENNEQLSEFPDDITSIILSSDESENEQVIILSSDESDNEQVVIFSSDESANDEPKINEEELVDRADSFFDKLNKMTESHFEVAEGVFKEVKNILQQINSEEVLNSSLDEGIEDCTLINEITTTDINNTSSDVIKKIADLIVNYMIQQCLEVNELILCPEVLYDSNVNKLLDKLKQIYKDFYEDSLSDEQKNDLRVSLFSFILNKLEVEEELNNSDDSIGSNTISDKIYTLSEFLSDILDHFFNLIGKPDSDKTFVAEEMCHSTPEGTKQIKPRIISPQSEQDIEITAFHQKTLTKSGSDLFWISVSPYINKKRQIQSSCDGINILSRKTEVLSPIHEEARINLFDTFDEKEFHNIIEEEEGSNPVENMEEKSYVNVVLSDKTNEYLQQDVTDNNYNKKKNIVICSDPDNKENNSLDNSDNWLGYDAAKF